MGARLRERRHDRANTRATGGGNMRRKCRESKGEVAHVHRIKVLHVNERSLDNDLH